MKHATSSIIIHAKYMFARQTNRPQLPHHGLRGASKLESRNRQPALASSKINSNKTTEPHFSRYEHLTSPRTVPAGGAARLSSSIGFYYPLSIPARTPARPPTPLPPPAAEARMVNSLVRRKRFPLSNGTGIPRCCPPRRSGSTSLREKGSVPDLSTLR